jgi:hypothetical protein
MSLFEDHRFANHIQQFARKNRNLDTKLMKGNRRLSRENPCDKQAEQYRI